MSDRRYYRRNPDLIPEWGADSGMVLRDCRQWRVFSARPSLLALLALLDRPRTAEDLHGLWDESPGPGPVAALLEKLADAGIVRHCPPDDKDEAADGWSPYELAVHRQAGSAGLTGRDLGASPPARLRHGEATATIPLPGAGGADSRPLATVLAERRTIRGYAPHPVPLSSLAAFLERAARVRGHLPPLAYQQTQRPTPSGGARHSLEIHVLARDVDGLEPGAYHYDPFGHVLDRLAPWDDGLTALQQRFVVAPTGMDAPPPISLYLTSCAERTAWKYSRLVLALIYRDTGCLLQTLCLTATDLGLAACPVGAVDASLSAPFLAPYRDRLMHVGGLALGLPGADPPPAVIPLMPDP
ncbi:SagB/ThcOx family dehydrogenase [Streptomyces sp. WAC05374]|uniref:SagB family peptide dehydrogenase n=1 Tax=Streptomyces sp. WAC05374 TaxID=2487420 RepID=UPI000F89A970|nr:SagB family peptide dehydrogenase [Streptomyces sp. WAC05374]RST14017.1 SagB/ThcOx family dehydrogenase [Streptomyces sp. WAC05374]TDF47255.1 SagB/ThcOx family dehydrogenase [Streptomyces sp. WAC05374]TDF57513.1 SagB/ThcOx family dehydrogenase [Streptomyces sp. WAC05374]TDF61618.1 SagB/ThcOx family dehydrogenase [Streptomyces sp. WAC05374]